MKNDKSTNKRAKNTSGPLLKFTMFSHRPKVGDYRLRPLTGGRMAVLEERGNPLARGAEEGDEVDPFTVYECFFVATLDGEELAELSVLEDEAWKIKLRGWAMEVDDDLLNEFWEVFNGELEAAKGAQTKARKKPKKAPARNA